MRVITKGYERGEERVGTIGLDWLLGVVLIGWRGGGRKAVILIHSAWPSPPSIPHLPLP